MTVGGFDPWSLAVVGWIAGSLVAGVAFAYAVGSDAAARGASGPFWGLFAWVLPLLAVPTYLYYRARRLPPRETPPGRLERGLGAFGIGVATASIVAAVVAPPDPVAWSLVGLPLAVAFVPGAAYVCYGPGWRSLRARGS